MDMPKKPEKSGRIVSLFKRKEPAQTKRQITSSSHASSADFGAQLPSFTSARAGDRQRTRKKYLDATKLLEASLKTYGEKWGLFDFPELNGEPETFEDSQFREKINAIMDAQKSKIADKEIRRKKELETALEYLCQQFEHLQMVKVLPDELEQRDFVVNRAMDVRSASMTYLASIIHHNSTPFGTPGKVAKTLCVGDAEIIDSKADLDKCIANYSRALSEIVGIRMIIEVRDIVKVPYQFNPRFTGRARFLQNLKEKLSDAAPMRYNHRVALYGMGGIGKTQCALAYVYSNRDTYERIYWITAVDQTSLLSGYQTIAKSARLHYVQNTTPVEIANGVLLWLRQEQSWLLIVDNLDDIKVVDGLLPENGPQKHTLITTRNLNTLGIPAEPLEVPLLSLQESVELLGTLLNISIPLESNERKQTEKIVTELQFLPLAIEQAAAYIRNAQNMEEFLEVFKKQRRKLLSWRPEGNYSYRYTVGTTWRMSLERLQLLCPSSINLIHLLAFLNPDEILIDYLQSGSEGLRTELQKLVENKFYLRESLHALESFSLIQVFGEGQKIRMHRLVQAVILDYLDADHRSLILSDVIELGLRSYPDIWDESIRETCRRYRSQATACLEHARHIQGNSKWHILAGRIAYYLRKDGFYTDCLYWSSLTFDVRMHILGPEHPDTLQSMKELASSYNALGRSKEGAQLHEKTMNIRKRVLGPEHRDTLQSMDKLAASYWGLGLMKMAVQLDKETLEIRKRVLGPEHPDTLKSMNGLGVAYWSLGQTKEAEQLHKETLEIRKRVLGEDHPDTLWSMNNLAASYLSLGRTKEAVHLDKETLEIRKRVLGWSIRKHYGA